MSVKIISAVSLNGVIGKNNILPWTNQYKADMQFFRTMTTNSAIIMGKNTWLSINRILPKRRNIVISKNNIENVENLETFDSLFKAIKQSKTTHEHTWLIGGSSIYREGMEFADELYITIIPEKIIGNNLVYFPWIDPSKFQVSEYIELEGNLKVAKYVRI